MGRFSGSGGKCKCLDSRIVFEDLTDLTDDADSFIIFKICLIYLIMIKKIQSKISRLDFFIISLNINQNNL